MRGQGGELAAIERVGGGDSRCGERDGDAGIRQQAGDQRAAGADDGVCRLLVPHARGLHLMPGWSYTGRKAATRDDAVSVAGYNLFNLGARYTPGGEQGHMTLRLYADNIADKRYWKDTGASYGDTFIHLGAPTTVRLSAHYTF